MFEDASQYPDYVITTAQLVGFVALLCLSYVSYRTGHAPQYELSTRTRGQACIRILLLTLGAVFAYSALLISAYVFDVTALTAVLLILFIPPYGIPYFAKEWFTRKADKNIHDTDLNDDAVSDSK